MRAIAGPDGTPKAETSKAVRILLYARIYVLAQFMERILTDPNVGPLKARLRFLLLQACPPTSILDNAELFDIFLHVSRAAQSFHTKVLEAATDTLLQQLIRSIRKLTVDCGSHSARLHVLIDEAQSATQDPWLYLPSEPPFLSQFLCMTDDILQPRVTLIAGSALSLSRLEQALALWPRKNFVGATSFSYTSGVSKTSPDDRSVCLDYINRHMPDLRNEKRLLERVLTWLHPRYEVPLV